VSSPEGAETPVIAFVDAAAFESLGRSGQYAVILDVVTTRTAATRAAHVRRVVADLGSGAGS